MIGNVIKNTKVENYRPECMIVAVNKNVTSRLFNIEGGNNNKRDKYDDNIDQITNPTPGSFTTSDMTATDATFTLASQHVR